MKTSAYRWMAAALLCAACGWPAVARAAQDNDDWRVPLTVTANDPEGDKLTYRWSQIDGPKVKIDNPTAQTTFFVPTKPGMYIFEVRVSDGQHEVSGQVKIPVKRRARPPVAIAGANGKHQVGQRIRVDGGASNHPDGEKIDEFEWKQVGGPDLKLTKAQLGDRMFYFDPEKPGRYEFELRVRSGEHWSAPSRVAYDVAPQNAGPVIIELPKPKEHEIPAPEADKPVVPALTKNPIPRVKDGGLAKVGQTLVLDGSASEDPLGHELSFFWRQIDNKKAPVLMSIRPDKRSATKEGSEDDPFYCPVWNVTPEKPGLYEFELVVTATDPKDRSKKREAVSKRVQFEILADNSIPKAKITLKQTVYEKNQNVTLDGSASFDEDGENLEYIWGWSGKGHRPTKWIAQGGARVQFTVEEVGTYGINLIVVDEQGNKSEPDSVEVEVREANRPPTVEVAKSVQGTLGLPVKIEAKVADEDNDRTEVEWKVLDPKTLKLDEKVLKANPLVFTPAEERVYVFEVIALDARSASEPKRVQVHVKAAKDLAPTAVLEGPRAGLTGQQVVLTAENSKDPDSKRLTYIWKQVPVRGGPAIPGAAPGPNEATWTFTPALPGTYKIRLVVSDGAHESEPDEHIVEIGTKNFPPEAKIQQPPVVMAGESTWLNGGESFDKNEEDQGKITYLWRVIEGADLVEIDGRDKPKMKVLAKAPGKAVFQLIVNDGQADSAPATVTLSITRKNTPPVARPEGPSNAQVGKPVVLTSDKSSDPDDGDKIAEYAWSQLEGSGEELKLADRDLKSSELRFTPTKPGAYLFQLVVSDQDGLKSKPVVWTVNVGQAVKPPVAEIKLKGTPPYVSGKPITFSGAGSSDPEGHDLSYKWRVVKGADTDLPGDPGNELIFTPKKGGDYVMELVVHNGQADSEPATVAFNVTKADRRPVAIIQKMVPVEPGEDVTLDGDKSYSPEGGDVDHRWACIEHPEGGEVNFGWRGHTRRVARVKLPKAGTYTFELKVYDGEVWSEPARASVTTRAANVAPKAAAVALSGFTAEDLKAGKKLDMLGHVMKGHTLVTEVNQMVVLDGSGSTDPDQGPAALTYEWTRLSGARPENLEEDGPRLRFVPTREGDINWELVVKDGKDASAPARVKVSVVKPGTLPVAMPRQKVINSPVARRDVKGLNNVIVLDGSASTCAEGKTLQQYQWKQIGGNDLRLNDRALAKPRVGLRIYSTGSYRFLLSVFDGEFKSLPAMVDVIVTDPSMKEEEPVKKSETTTRQEVPKEEDPGDDSGALLPPPKEVQTGRNEPKPAVTPEPVEAKPEERPLRVPGEEPARYEARTPEPAKQPEPEAPKTAEKPATPREERIPPPKEPAVKPEPVMTEAPEEPREPEPAPLLKPKNDPLAWLETIKTEKWSDTTYRGNDPLFKERKEKIAALATKPGREAETDLLRYLEDRDPDLRSLAAYTLARRGFGSVPSLIRVLDGGSEVAKPEAHKALVKVSGKNLKADARAWKDWYADEYGLTLD